MILQNADPKVAERLAVGMVTRLHNWRSVEALITQRTHHRRWMSLYFEQALYHEAQLAKCERLLKEV